MKLDATPYITTSFSQDTQHFQECFSKGVFEKLFGTFHEKDVGLVLDVTATEITAHYKRLLEEELCYLDKTTKDAVKFLEEHPDQIESYDNCFGDTLYEKVFSDLMWVRKDKVKDEMVDWTLSHVTVPLTERTMPCLIATYLDYTTEKYFKQDPLDFPDMPTDSEDEYVNAPDAFDQDTSITPARV